MPKRIWGMTGIMLTLMIEGMGPLAPVAHAQGIPAVESLTVQESALGTGSVHVSALARDPKGQALYQFWVETRHGWSVAQNYSARSFLSLPADLGSRVVTVYALDKTAWRHNDWQAAKARTVIINRHSSVKLSSLATGTAGDAVTFQSEAAHLIQPVYQYWVENPQGQWTASGNYQNTPNWAFTPRAAGTYRVVAYAKDLMAPSNATDAVWTTHVMTVAPAVPQGYQLAIKLANPEAALNNAQALLLGQSAALEAVVRNDQGQAVADVPVVFTATNNSNPNDHVSFAQGLDAKTYTNAQGIAVANLYVSNPHDVSSSALRQDPQALTQVGYRVSLPTDSLVAPVKGHVDYAAYIPPNLSVQGLSADRILTEPLYGSGVVQHTSYVPWLGAGQSAALSLRGHFLLPVASKTGSLTIPVHYHSGAYGPDVLLTSSARPVSKTLPTITVPSGFNTAYIKFTRVGLSAGSSLTIAFAPAGDHTPSWTKTLTGPVQREAQSISIPPSATGGQLTFRLQAGSVVNPLNATGVGIESVVVDLSQGLDPEVVPASLPVTWKTVPIRYGPWQTLSSQEAAQYRGLGAKTSAQVTYRDEVPVFPQVGNALIEKMAGNVPQSYYWIPTVNNDQNQNVLASPLTPGIQAMPISSSMLSNLVLPASRANSSWRLTSAQAGQSEIMGQVNLGHTVRPSDVLYSYVGWLPSSPLNTASSQYAFTGQQVQIAATVRDALGNVVPGALVNWSVPEGVNVVKDDSTTNSQGIATLTLSAVNPATITVNATSPGENVLLTDGPGQTPFSTAQIHFVGWHWNYLPQSPLSFGVGNPREIGVTATALSASGHTVPLTHLNLTLSSRGVGHAGWSALSTSHVQVLDVSSDKAGRQKMVISPSALEPHVQIAGQPDVGYGPISGMLPDTLNIHWKPAQGILTLVDPASFAAMGAKVPLEVKVADRFGNPVPNQPITWSLWDPAGGRAALTSVHSVTNAQGLAQVFLQGGRSGEGDEVGVSMPGQSTQTALVRWQTPSGPSMAVVGAQVNGSRNPNTVTVMMSRRVNPQSVLADGAQFQLEDLSTHTVYPIAQARVSGSRTVTLTLAASNPVLNFDNQIYQVSVQSVTASGVMTSVMDFQSQTAQGAVAVETPSSPTLIASVSAGSLHVTLGNGEANIPAGLTLSVVPSNAQASVNNQPAGRVYQTALAAGTAPETLSVPVSGPSGSFYTLYFDGTSSRSS